MTHARWEEDIMSWAQLCKSQWGAMLDMLIPCHMTAFKYTSAHTWVEKVDGQWTTFILIKNIVIIMVCFLHRFQWICSSSRWDFCQLNFWFKQFCLEPELVYQDRSYLRSCLALDDCLVQDLTEVERKIEWAVDAWESGRPTRVRASERVDGQRTRMYADGWEDGFPS